MSVFADSSALVKLYADEDGHEEVRALSTVVVSQLARVEVPSAIWRKQRMGEVSVNAAALLVAAFEADYFGSDEAPPLFTAIIAPTPAVMDAAARFTSVHGLRAYDAVQLASGCAAAAADPECDTLAAFDAALRAAAATEGFSLVPAAG